MQSTAPALTYTMVIFKGDRNIYNISYALPGADGAAPQTFFNSKSQLVELLKRLNVPQEEIEKAVTSNAYQIEIPV